MKGAMFQGQFPSFEVFVFIKRFEFMRHEARTK